MLLQRKIQLTPQEHEITKALIRTSEYICKHVRPDEKPLTLRIAGGWVRDRLMGIECHDIDVATDNMMGFEFAQHLQTCCTDPANKVKAVYQIKANPDKSKHLETASLTMHGMDVDFVNLRTDAYRESTRVPTVEFGTPQQDAERRDLTINALFYNVHSDTVEDFTGRGLQDLQNSVVRTPLTAQQTFMDDPLRMLRAVRFAARFNFSIASDTFKAFASNDARKQLLSVVSRERVTIELMKMLENENALRAVELLDTLGMMQPVFMPHFSGTMTFDSSMRSLKSLELMLAQPWVLHTSKQSAKLMRLAAIITLMTQDHEHSGNNGEQFGAQLGNSTLTLSNHEKSHVKRLQNTQAELHALSRSLPPDVDAHVKECTREEYETLRQQLGLLLMKVMPNETSMSLTEALVFAKSQELAKYIQIVSHESQQTKIQDDELYRVQYQYSPVDETSIATWNGECIRMLKIVDALQLNDLYAEKSMIDGKQILAVVVQALETASRPPVSTGPWLAKVKQMVFEWQLRQGGPRATDYTADACRQFVKSIVSGGQLTAIIGQEAQLRQKPPAKSKRQKT